MAGSRPLRHAAAYINESIRGCVMSTSFCHHHQDKCHQPSSSDIIYDGVLTVTADNTNKLELRLQLTFDDSEFKLLLGTMT
jgi:hypothetical protein